MLVIVGSTWHLFPEPIADAIPDIGALTAGFLGLTVRRGIAAALAGSIVLGYLRDVVSGAPPGCFALVLAMTCLIARAVQQRLYVRGAAMTVAFSGFVSIASSLVARAVRSVFHIPGAALSLDLRDMILVAGATALISPIVWRMFRRIDAAFARTQRERDAALDGLAPR